MPTIRTRATRTIQIIVRMAEDIALQTRRTIWASPARVATIITRIPIMTANLMMICGSTASILVRVTSIRSPPKRL